MKNVLIAITVCLTILFAAGYVSAVTTETCVTTDVSSVSVVGAANGVANRPIAVPEISSSTAQVRIKKVVLSNTVSDVAQTITLYDGCRTTSTVTAIWSVVIPSGTFNSPVVLDFTDVYPLRADYGMYIRKSIPGSTVISSILYW